MNKPASSRALNARDWIEVAPGTWVPLPFLCDRCGELDACYSDDELLLCSPCHQEFVNKAG